VKALTLIFVILIALLQYPLWLGKGSWLRVWDLNRQIAEQQEKNNGLKARNETLNAEVLDLKSGRAAIEERARSELGMVKQDEVFYQVLENTTTKTLTTSTPTTGTPSISTSTISRPSAATSAATSTPSAPANPMLEKPAKK
jgi:cell division protein FtsB